MTIPTLTTARLMLRAFAEDDAGPLFEILSDGEALLYFPGPKIPSREQVQRLVESQIRHWERHGYGWWAVQERDRAGKEPVHALIGWCGLGFLPETGEVEVSYLLGKPYWGRGLITEGARASVRYGFETVRADEIVGIVHPENAASRRVLVKLGMSFVERKAYFGMDCERYTIDRAAYVQGGVS